jgi:uncharacterized RDD family membrane protein YckC
MDGSPPSDAPNPYAPPRTDGDAGFDPPIGLADASLGTRLLNFFIDSIVRQVLIVLSVVASSLISRALRLPSLGGAVIVTGTLTSFLGYHVVFEWLIGRTPAKFLTGTRVVTVSGGKPSFGQILGRTLARFVPFEPFSFFGSTPTGWHDRWSGTRVVRV